LTTETGRQTAAAKIAIVEREIETRLARRRQLRPGLMRGTGGPTPADPLLEELWGGGGE
jgi:hypothetical protein